MLIDRPQAIRRVVNSFHVHPAVALVGPRQCGKTTLAQVIAADEREVTFFDLERAVDRRRLEAPEQALSPLAGLMVIDEIQRFCSMCGPSFCSLNVSSRVADFTEEDAQRALARRRSG